LDDRYAVVRGLLSHARKKFGPRVLWRSPNQLLPTHRRNTAEGGETTFGEAVDADALHTLPRLVRELSLPVLDAFAVTNRSAADSVDGLHYNRWELEHEVHLFLSQVQCLHRHGVW
jgi:hypothetical protein